MAVMDLQGHGRRAPDIDRPLSFEQEAGDVAALMRQLDIRKQTSLAKASAASSRGTYVKFTQAGLDLFA